AASGAPGPAADASFDGAVSVALAVVSGDVVAADSAAGADPEAGGRAGVTAEDSDAGCGGASARSPSRVAITPSTPKRISAATAAPITTTRGRRSLPDERDAPPVASPAGSTGAVRAATCASSGAGSICSSFA